MEMYRIENGNGLRFVFCLVSHFIRPTQRECNWINGIADSINRPYNLDESPGPHEMAVTLPNVATPPTSARPFSFTDSESGYKKDEEPGRTL
jgi:hypothetical protein